MSSIAYITDGKMIEYHRLNGNRIINFWKPSNMKKINDFKVGDYLFFLAKGTEKGVHKEKGLLGYGKLKKMNTFTFRQMWEKYGILNGYPTKDQLQEAIMKVTKNHELPSSLSCFLLSDVTFFQGPVYLSEINFHISNKIESYIYLDKSNMSNTAKILELANKVGVDTWSTIFDLKSDEYFLKDAKYNFICNIVQKLDFTFYSRYDEKRIRNFLEENFKNKNSKIIYKIITTCIEDDLLSVYIPCIVNTSNFMKKLQFSIGCYMMIKSYLIRNHYENDIRLYLFFNQPVEKEIKELLEIQSIKFIESNQKKQI